jgi:hypothetical protein
LDEKKYPGRIMLALRVVDICGGNRTICIRGCTGKVGREGWSDRRKYGINMQVKGRTTLNPSRRPISADFVVFLCKQVRGFVLRQRIRCYHKNIREQ